MPEISERTILTELRIGRLPFRKRVRFEIEQMQSLFSGYAYVGKRQVGKIAATNYDATLTLGELYVVEPKSVRPELADYWARGAFRHYRHRPPRSRTRPPIHPLQPPPSICARECIFRAPIITFSNGH